MAIEAAIGFVKLVMEDEELRQRTADLKPEEVVDIAKEKGFVFTAEELTEASNEVREITSDELEAATGGGSKQVVPSNSHARAKKIWCKGQHKNGKHNYVFSRHTEEKCLWWTNGYNVYKCTRCGFEYKISTDGKGMEKHSLADI